MNKNSITILGSGTSTGTPVVGCTCSVCSSTNKFNQRLRTSLLLSTATNKNFLIETSPDLRSQLIQNHISKVDCTIISHDHADHLHGIDDLRPLCFGPPPQKIPVYCEKQCSKTIKKRFPYIFDNKPLIGGGIPLLELNPIKLKIDQLVPIHIEKELFHFFPLPHGRCKSMGFIHESFIYIPDCSILSPKLLQLLHNSKPKLLIITCLQESPHDTHLDIKKSFDYIQQISPQSAVLIHMNHQLEHDQLKKRALESFSFPVEPAYDNAKYHY